MLKGVYISNLFTNFYRPNKHGIKLENKPINPAPAPTNTAGEQQKLNDIGFRLILIPFFGIAIPLVTGIARGIALNHWQVKLSFLYTIGIAFIIWEGNRYLLFTLRSYFNWHNKPVKKIIALVLAISFYTVPVSLLLVTGWYHIFSNGVVNRQVLLDNTLLILICVIFITHVYETVFLVKEAENERVRKEQTERARAEAELEALKNQIDPHFIFNSLNTLGHLIDEDPAKARLFNNNLADMYRYILHHKNRQLVQLREELYFLQQYFSLLTIRFGGAVLLRVELPGDAGERFLIPPISLQVLMENGIKHNEFSDLRPLELSMALEGNELVVHNTVSRKELRRPSSKIGLHNLGERYRLITGMDITVTDTGTDFYVRLPLLPIT